MRVEIRLRVSRLFYEEDLGYILGEMAFSSFLGSREMLFLWEDFSK
jgi:hypothetical protein